MPRPDRSLRELTGYRLRRSSVSVMSAFKDLFVQFGLRRTTFSTLVLIVDNPGLRQGELADALAIERPNLVQIVDELERKGLVKRQAAKNDRRAYCLTATRKGRDLYRKAMGSVAARDVELTRGLTPEQVANLHVALSILQQNALSMETRDEYEVSGT